MKCSRWLDIVVAISLVAVPLTGCAGQQPRGEDPQSFGSIDEAYAAVDDVLGCDSKPGGDPVVPVQEFPSGAPASLISSGNFLPLALWVDRAPSAAEQASLPATKKQL